MASNEAEVASSINSTLAESESDKDVCLEKINTQVLAQQPTTSTVALSSKSVSFSESESEGPDSFPTPLAVVGPSTSGEAVAFGSGNYSNCSSADATIRTRLETMDSANMYGNEDAEVGHGYDVDHRTGTPLPPGRISATFNAVSGDLEEPPPSKMVHYARRFHKHWVYATKQLQDLLLSGVVKISVLAANYPRITVVVLSGISLALIIGGYCTNFTLRVDNDKIFTPSSSEVVEFSNYLGNMLMYEGVETNRRRKLQQARTWRKLSERKLLTVSIIDDEDMISNIVSSTESKGDIPNATDLDSVASIEIVNPSEALNETETEEEEAAIRSRGHGSIFPILIHANTANVFTIEGINKLFDVFDYMKTQIPGYDEACSGDQGSFHDDYGRNTCEIRAITRFWRHNRTLFQEQIKTEEDLFDAADAIFYPDRGFVDLPFVLAEYEEDEHGRPISGQAFFCWVFVKNAGHFRSMTDSMLNLQAEWKRSDSTDTHFVLEFVTPDSFAQEVQRAILDDIPLIPIAFVVMSLFTCLVFFRCHRVYSRGLLGIGAVVTVVMSTLSGYGLMFIAGVPMTVMTNLLIFVVFGVGLDDTFIITGEYFRTNHKEDPVDRIERTMEAVGSSIFLTSITTAVAFMLGCTSSIQPIRWLCLYAFPTILIDFIYQITFFIAILILDEQRIMSNRMDCCICIRVEMDEEGDTNDEGSTPEQPVEADPSFSAEDDLPEPLCKEAESKPRDPFREKHKSSRPPKDIPIADRCMGWFACRLLHPAVKVFVLLAFTVFTVVCAYSTSKLTQRFNFKDLLPSDSYAIQYATAVEQYSDRAIAVRVVFRFVDQADEEVRNQMERYVEELVEKVDALNEEAPFFWVREFRTAVAADPSLQGLPFYEQLGRLLQNPTVQDAVGHSIRYRHDGTILNSEVLLYVTDLDMDDVRAQINFLKQQRAVTRSQPINQGKKLWSFFSYDLLFHIFAFYEVAAGELTSNTISSVTAVGVITLLLIPHWSAVPIIVPLLSALYIEMMGVLQMLGYSINVVTYVVLVVSIGLLVDFLMHILLRYYESECDNREEKVKDVLGTMGASILVGGLSTFLGVVPLIFSSSTIFSTVCVAFLVMVSLGVVHGLIVLPVMLSYFGPETVIHHRKRISLIRVTGPESDRLHQSKHQSLCQDQS